MSNSPRHVLARLLHREDMGDYFKNIPEIDMKLWKPKILEHLQKCRHENCSNLRETANSNSLFLEDLI